MSIELLNSTSAPSSAFRVVCGEMSVTNKSVPHQEALFGYVRQGWANFDGFDGGFTLQKDDIFFVAPNVKYWFSSFNNVIIDAITINFVNPSAITQDYVPQNILRALLNGNCTGYARITTNEKYHSAMLQNMKSVIKAETEKGEFFQLLVYGKIYELFYTLFFNKIVRLIDIESKSKKYRSMMRITSYIDNHFAEEIYLDDVANFTGISRYYVSHLFKELMNTTFVGYVNELRLNHAAVLLITSDKPIIEVAAESGFINLSNFNRAFKLHFGKTPSAYRHS